MLPESIKESCEGSSSCYLQTQEGSARVVTHRFPEGEWSFRFP